MEDTTASVERCDVCDAEMVPGRSPRAEGAFVAAAVEIEPFDVLACPSGHEIRYPYPEWGNELRALVVAALPFATPAGAGHLCLQCQSPLSGGEGDDEGRFPLDLHMRHGVELQLTATLPVVVCPRCGTGQALLTGDLENDLEDALTEAFESAGLEP
jgi:hypothetical protein